LVNRLHVYTLLNGPWLIDYMYTLYSTDLGLKDYMYTPYSTDLG